MAKDDSKQLLKQLAKLIERVDNDKGDIELLDVEVRVRYRTLLGEEREWGYTFNVPEED